MEAPRSLDLHQDDAVVRDEWKFVLSHDGRVHILEVSRGDEYREYRVEANNRLVAKDGEEICMVVPDGRDPRRLLLRDPRLVIEATRRKPDSPIRTHDASPCAATKAVA